MNQNDNFSNTITEHLFREFYQEVFSSLVLKFGSSHIDLIEDALQEAFYKALKSWKVHAYPKKPKGWLFIVARNYIINRLKRDQKHVAFSLGDLEIETITTSEKEDAQLRLLSACTKLQIKEEAKLIFTLKSICGFGVDEIANSLLISKDNIYKQLQRSKGKLQALPEAYFSLDQQIELSDENIQYIESIVYFMFNEGYDSVNASSPGAINKEICFEAVRLAHLLEKHSTSDSSKHLLALCYFHMARFDSRIDEDGSFISLRAQDRSLWDKEMIQLGFRYLVKPVVLNRYYLEALIASIHLSAPTFLATDWNEISIVYNALLECVDTPVIRLNRAICLFELGKNVEATKELEKIKLVLENDYFYFSMSMAEYLEDKDIELSRYWYEQSLIRTKQRFRKELIRSKILKLNA